MPFLGHSKSRAWHFARKNERPLLDAQMWVPGSSYWRLKRANDAAWRSAGDTTTGACAAAAGLGVSRRPRKGWQDSGAASGAKALFVYGYENFMMGRTSIEPDRAPGIFAAMATAAS